MIKIILKSALLATVLSGLMLNIAVASPEEACLDMGGTIDDAGFCVVIDVQDDAFARMVRPSGNSGLGWTVVGIATTTTITMYEQEYTPGETIDVLIPGDPTLPGCNNSNNTPKKCTDHYESVTSPGTYAWVEIYRESNTVYNNTSCLNPANKDMGTHRQCWF